MYPQGNSLLRADLRGVVEEASMMQEEFVGLKALPALPVPNKAGQYPVIQRAGGQLLRNIVQRRGPASDYARISRATTTDTYTCMEYGIEELIDDGENEDYSRFFNVASKALTYAYRQVWLAHEIRAAALLFNRANFTATTSATAYTAANLATFDVGLDIDIVKQGIKAAGESTVGLTAIMSEPTFNLIRASTRLQNRIRGTVGTDTFLTLDRQAVADALGLKEVLVGGASYDASKEGNSASMSQIWSNANIWVGRVAPAAGPEAYFSGGAAYTLFWQQDAAIIQVDQYREDRKRSSVVRARQYTDEKIVLANAGYLLATGS